MTPPLRLHDRTIVGRLRLRANGAVDPSSARLRLESALGDVGLGGAAIPPSALLCIRALRDPLPGALSLAWTSPPPAAWKRAIDEEVARAARRATRPFDGASPTDEAVLFRDRAELLACLALDWLRGNIGGLWWWKYLVREGATERLAPAQWAAEAAYVPAAASALAGKGELVAFANALSAEEARGIVRALDEAFGTESASGSSAMDASAAQLVRPAPGAAAAMPASLPPSMSAWVPELDDRAVASPLARAFIAMSLGLVRGPSVARRPAWRGVVEDWLARDAAGAAGAPSVEPPRATDPRAAGAPTNEAVLAGPPTESPLATEHAAIRVDVAPASAAAASTVGPRPYEVKGEGPGQAGVPSSRAADPLDDGGRPQAPPPSPEPGGHEPERGVAASSARAPDGSEAKERADAAADRDVANASPPPPLPPRPLPRPTVNGTAITTAYGGAFFLLNVLLALELYGDFTRPRSRALDVSPWTLLARLARGLLADSGDAAGEDPLWWVLRDLAGKEDAEAWPAEFRAAPESLGPFPETSGWTWREEEGRLLVEHPADFLVLDAAMPEGRDAAAEQREQEWARYGVTGVSGVPGRGPRPAWPEDLVRYVRARLHAAVRAEDPGASARLALRIRARVRATESHVDVHMALADLPIEVRLAGLDRDPGWVPAAGRFVAFRFE